MQSNLTSEQKISAPRFERNMGLPEGSTGGAIVRTVAGKVTIEVLPPTPAPPQK